MHTKTDTAIERDNRKRHRQVDRCRDGLTDKYATRVQRVRSERARARERIAIDKREREDIIKIQRKCKS